MREIIIKWGVSPLGRKVSMKQHVFNVCEAFEKSGATLPKRVRKHLSQAKTPDRLSVAVRNCLPKKQRRKAIGIG